MRKTYIFLLIALLPLELAAQFAGGTGTQGDPYLVASAAQLNEVRNNLSSYFLQTADIDLGGDDSSGDYWNGGFGWTPIGTESNEFIGGYDGGGYTISGLYINRFGNYDHYGLFGYVENDGDTTNNGLLYNINLIEADVLARSHVGGLAGWINGTVLNCSVSGSVSGSTHVGALVGTAWSATKILSSNSSASVSGSGSVGGLVGTMYKKISRSYATGSVSGGTGPSGGLVGNKASGEVHNSFASGTVSGSSTNGGIGGLIGTNEDTVLNSYSIGQVSATGINVGGLVGLSSSPGTYIINSYWNTETSGQSSSDGGSGLTSSEMKNQTNFSSWNFSSIWGITKDFTFPFLQNSSYRVTELEISGDEGWRMMSSPLVEKSYNDILVDFWTQGFSGSDYPSATDPSLYIRNEAGQSWDVPSGSAIPDTGLGWITYLFDDQDYDGNPDGFPKTLSIEGNEPEGTITPEISFTNTGNMSLDGWNLVGNPFASTIDWDAASGWTKSNLDASIYIWSDATGAYLSWNGISGTLTNGLITPFQGFWVKANSANPILLLDENVKSSGGSFYKQSVVPQITLTLKSGAKESSMVLMFSNKAKLGKDPLDAYKLESLNADYMSLFSTLEDGTALDINAIPVDESHTLKIPIDLEGTNLEKEAKIIWLTESIPENLELVLVDNETNSEINLKNSSFLNFPINEENPQKKKESTPDLLVPKQGFITPAIMKKETQEKSRFTLVISASNAVANEEVSSIPSQPVLYQNYPNPFNPTTNIRYELPASQKVILNVFDIQGREVAVLVNQVQSPGSHTVMFDASQFASGVYFYQLKVGATLATNKMILLK